MCELKLVSPGERQIKPLVEAALNNEIKLMDAGIHRTQARLRDFEKKYHMETKEFVAQYESDMIKETMDHMEWIGEFRMLQRLIEKSKTLKSIRIEN
ncbi:MAG: hypothetical protein HZA01_00030 [Nitrospinae bacterium]|nr:hypothetical protein [Nitrospinota bacterium]